MDRLDRMYSILKRAISETRPGLESSPFTVADIHQQILPFRHYRQELELDTNDEYELTLMELVSGARGYLEVDEQLRDELGKELKSKTPEPSRVRDFADAQVSLSSAAKGPSDASEKLDQCRYCGGDLPTGRKLQYCPHCGQNLQVRNCSAWGAEVESGWKFCVACGKTLS